MNNYIRRKSNEIHVGSLTIGGNNPIRIQTMANTDTNNIESSLEQAITCIQKGAELIRFTTQGEKEANNLGHIRSKLQEMGYYTPIVADVHFNPKVAEVAASLVEKVRINPGNFVKGKTSEYSEKEWDDELNEIKEKLRKLIDICTTNNTAIRIGVNHGSLSPRIMTRYGNTPLGLASSCMEFINICEDLNFHNIILSVKASNTIVMIHAVRLLVKMMDEENKHYPIHLGVTEAGSDMEGRIKSAVGIGTLLNDGIGDTIRVSLSEAPEMEIPVGRKIVEYINTRINHSPISETHKGDTLQTSFSRRKTNKVGKLGGMQAPIVLSSNQVDMGSNSHINPDMTIADLKNYMLTSNAELNSEVISFLQTSPSTTILLVSNNENPVGDMRAAIHKMDENNIKNPIIIVRAYNEEDLETLQIKASIDMGPLFIDGLADGLYIFNNTDLISEKEIIELSFTILQSSRARISKTEYISCPTCGRTKFDLPEAIRRVKQATSHLVGLKIAVMGCIVNGPGEMTDADFGYIGAGEGKVSLYKKDKCIMKNIPEEDAIDALLNIISDNQ